MTSHAGPEGPVLFRTIAVLEPVILCFWRRPKPVRVLGALWFRTLPCRLRVKVVRLELDFLFGLPPDVLGTEA